MTARNLNILLADDDPDDRMLIKDAIEENHHCTHLRMVEDGEELLDCLHRRGKYVSSSNWSIPNLILLDLNMPRKDGREALAEIKKDPALCRIPTVVLTTSKAEEDILRTYDLGVNSFVTKPTTYDALVGIMKMLIHYWFETVQLPPERLPVHHE